MCRIASLFLLQRLKGSMSGDARDFNNIKTRTVIKFFFLPCKARRRRKFTPFRQIHQRNMHHRMPPSKTGWPSLNVVIFPPGRPKTVTTPEIIEQIHELIFEDRRISAKSIAEQLGISRKRVGSIIHEDFDMRKLSASWVPKCLNADQRHQRCQSSEKSLEFFRRDPDDFLSRLVTMDETWVYHFDPETKQKAMEWRHNGSPRPKKFRVQKSAGNVLVSIFLGIKTAFSSLIIFQRAKLSTRSITHLCWCN